MGRCEDCGERLRSRDECPICHGDDDYGMTFCINCDYCCGC